MSSPLLQTIDAVNGRIRVLLAETRRALTGQREFGVEQVRALSESVQEMAPVMARAAELRVLEPEIGTQLDLYKSQLRELQTALDQVQVMLLTRRSQMQVRQGQLQAVAQWAGALQQTQ